MYLIIISLLFPLFQNISTLEVYDLKCEHEHNPIQIDHSDIKFSWRIRSNVPDVFQDKIRITVGTDPLVENVIYDSKWISNNKPFYRLPKDMAFAENTKYYWKIEVIDNNKSTSSQISSFETGIKNENWIGKWISDNKPKEDPSALYFRKKIFIKSNIKKAEVYIVAGGLYELYLNNKLVNHDKRMTPNFTNFSHYVLYDKYHVGSFLNADLNVIGLILGSGYYNHFSKTAWRFNEAEWRNRPKFKFSLYITYENNETEVISSDDTWLVSDGEIILNSAYTGECIDLSKKQDNWSTSDFNDSHWEKATIVSPITSDILSNNLPPIQITDTLKVKYLYKISDSEYTVDFGKNIAGITQFNGLLPAKMELSLLHGEQINPINQVDISNLTHHFTQTYKYEYLQADYIITNDPENVKFAAKFNNKGFQYVTLKGNKNFQLEKDNILALKSHTNVKQIGYFNTSNELLNKIWEACNNSYLTNLLGLPTGCATREKEGWTGDAHTIAETGLLHYDGIKLYEKWMRDHRYALDEFGLIPSIIPTFKTGYGLDNGFIDWTSSMIFIPYYIYQYYGDKKILEDNYEHMKKFYTNISNNYLATFGDWNAPFSKSNKHYIGTLFLFECANKLSKIAKVLNKEEDIKYYTSKAMIVKKEIYDNFFDKNKKVYGSGTQTELSLALYYEVFYKNDEMDLVNNLVTTLENSNYTMNIGLHGTKTLLTVLTKYGRNDIAYKLASTDTYPSWGNLIVKGATTMYESWDYRGYRYPGSQNHPYFGSINQWFMKKLGGIDINFFRIDPSKQITIKPNFTHELKYCNVSYESIYGEIISHWKTKEDYFIHDIKIPTGSQVTYSLPDGYHTENSQTEIKLSSGSYSYKIIQNHIPKIEDTIYYIKEKINNFSVLGQVTISDKDIYDIPNVVSYKGDTDVFSINDKKQLVLIDSTIFFRNLKEYYELNVTISDKKSTIDQKIKIYNINFREFKLTIYPNPTNEILYINFNQITEVEEITIIDAVGKKSYNINSFEYNNSIYNINISHLKRGTYILIIKTKDQTFNKKLIKL